MRIALLALVAALTVPRTAAADDAVTASMSCERATQPGRVKCSAEAHVTGGKTLAWADVAIVELPAFAAALKGRIGPPDATAHDATSTTWAFGLVAKKAGQGEARAKVRLVVCEGGDAGASRCAPQTIDVKTVLVVGG